MANQLASVLTAGWPGPAMRRPRIHAAIFCVASHV